LRPACTLGERAREHRASGAPAKNQPASQPADCAAARRAPAGLRQPAYLFARRAGRMAGCRPSQPLASQGAEGSERASERGWAGRDRDTGINGWLRVWCGEHRQWLAGWLPRLLGRPAGIGV